MARGSAEKGRKSRTTVGTRRAETRKGGGYGRRKYTEGGAHCSVEKQTHEVLPMATRIAHKTLPKDNPNSEHSKPGNAKQIAFKNWFDAVVELGLPKIRKDFVTKVRKYTPDGSHEICQTEENATKNRYDDVNLLDKTRVKVNINPDKDDYIHASMVEVHSELSYICAQGPMDNTIAQFWLMCIQEDVKVILQLCQNIEDGKEKCSEYMADGKSDWVTYGCVQVKQIDSQKNVAGTKKVNRTKVEVKFEDKTHSVTHLLYSGWPDHGVPESVSTCREVRNMVHKLYEKKPIVIHCSAGIGRTGTFVAIEMVCHRLMKEEDFNFSMMDIIKKLRDQRMHAVQNDQQYAFVYRCVIEVLIAEDCLSRNSRVIQFIQEFEDMVERKKKQRANKD
ncbi:unnamed protein product [Bursaphelenchus okinawaensis]|uniref:Uncharacterized protein n=1 Tax=Bursaphelenchus okinawaensis TaxID=465554 RepID=A0A811KZP6_9BILA|nr:unnamed protein product [Bursaphelenchus okinawaensis]CAG9113569.1 unnamed protein product [Bursaphelenchus okinawaensis]